MIKWELKMKAFTTIAELQNALTNAIKKLSAFAYYNSILKTTYNV